MIAADRPVRHPAEARLLYVDADGRIQHAPRSSLADFLSSGDLVVANDAATLPASLHGLHERTRQVIEVRLAGRDSPAPEAVDRFIAIVFGAGDHRMPTENRGAPPELRAGDRLRLGPLTATIERLLDHPRLVAVRFAATPGEIWQGLAQHGRAIQYAHVSEPLELWDVWTSIAGQPAAYEPPSAGFVLDWRMLGALRARDIGFVTLTHAAGISSTGDPQLDRRLPLDEHYFIPHSTADAIARARREDRRVVAIGTTVVRALEHSVSQSGVVTGGAGIATQRLGANARLRVVDAIVSGTHEPGTSHYELLQAFATSAVLRRAHRELDAAGFRTHEFGDSVLIERDRRRYRRKARAGNPHGIFVANPSTGPGGGATYTRRFFAHPRPCGSGISSSIACLPTGRSPPPTSNSSSPSVSCSPAAASTCKAAAGYTPESRNDSYTRRTGST